MNRKERFPLPPRRENDNNGERMEGGRIGEKEKEKNVFTDIS